MLATKAVAETNACTYPGRTVKIPTEAEVSERRIRATSRAAKLFCPLPNPIDHSRHFVVGIYSEGQPEHRHEYEYIKRNWCWTLLRSRSAEEECRTIGCACVHHIVCSTIAVTPLVRRCASRVCMSTIRETQSAINDCIEILGPLEMYLLQSVHL